MYKYPNMLLLGSAGRNSGKTEFACQLIRRFRTTKKVIGLKITTIDHNGRPCPRDKEDCGVCTSFSGKYELTRETTGPEEKDTVRMLEAGADQVFWLKVHSFELNAGVSALASYLDEDACIICESNSCRRVLEPGIFLVMQQEGSKLVKKTCRSVMHHADRILNFHGSGWSLGSDSLVFENGRWSIPDQAQ